MGENDRKVVLSELMKKVQELKKEEEELDKELQETRAREA